jgi:tetratricopeptide (TPR) repeat protein
MAEKKKKISRVKNPRVQEQRSPVAPESDYTGGKRFFKLGAALSLLVSFAVYIRTMAGSSSFWDSGEFIAASYTLGVPHSPGTPLYVLVGRVFTLLPIPVPIAVRVNLISALCGALGALFIYLLVVRFLDAVLGRSKSDVENAIKVIGGLVGAFFITFSNTYWTNATEAEVYAMSCFLMGFMTWIGLKWEEKAELPRGDLLIYLLFYLLALSVGFHLGTMLAFSGVFFYILMTREKRFSNLEFLVACFGVGIFMADATLYRSGSFTMFLVVVFVLLVLWLYTTKSSFALSCTLLFILGLSVHLYLLIRSGHNPAIDEGDPETWKALYAVLRREQYPPMNVFVRKASFLFQLQHFNGYFQEQFEMFRLYIGRLNLGSAIPIGLGLWGMVDHYTRHKKTFVMLFTTFLVTSLGLIIFLNFSDHEVRERDYFYSPAFYYFAIFIGIGAASIMNEVKKLYGKMGGTAHALTYALGGLLLFFPLVTGHHYFFKHDRSKNFVCREYAKNMLGPLEKDAIIFTNGDNDTFPLWYIQEVEHFRKDVRVVNLSLLNTPWYIKQLRDNEPKLPITWSDEKVDRLQPIPSEKGWILIRDLAIAHIVRENKWRRPIYFAVTIPPESFAPYRDYLQMEGLVFKMVPKKGTNMIAEEKLEDNVYRKFSYKSILTEDWKRDDSLYLAPYIRHLIQNYAAAFCQVAYVKRKHQKTDEAIKALEIAEQIAPDIDPVVLFLGWYYFEQGDTAKAIAQYDKEIKRHPERPELLYRLAGIYERTGDLPKALSLLDRVVRENPLDRDAVLSAFGIAAKLGMTSRAKSYLENWLKSHPNDKEIRSALEQMSKPVK